MSEKPKHMSYRKTKAGLYDLVIIARKEPPVPISNTTVKLLSADGTMSQGMGEYVVAKSYKPAFFCNSSKTYIQGSKMTAVPIHKLDMETCLKLVDASDEQVLENLDALLEWLQDINWPIATPIGKRLLQLDLNLVVPIQKILNSNDHIWKYWILDLLIRNGSIQLKNAFREYLEKLASNPTKTEKEEEIDIVAKEILEYNDLKKTK